jgi:hypothetical protein
MFTDTGQHANSRSHAGRNTGGIRTFRSISVFPGYLRLLKVKVGGHADSFCGSRGGYKFKEDRDLDTRVEVTPCVYTSAKFYEARHLWQKYKAKAQVLNHNPSYEDLVAVIVTGSWTAERPFEQIHNCLMLSNIYRYRLPEHVWPRAWQQRFYRPPFPPATIIWNIRYIHVPHIQQPLRSSEFLLYPRIVSKPHNTARTFR